MSAWEIIGLIVAALHLFLAFFVAVSLGEAARRGSAAGGTIYLIVAFATIVWITRSVLWQQ